MPSSLASVLKEQHAVIHLLFGRVLSARQDVAVDVDSLNRALYSHLLVVETIVLPALVGSGHHAEASLAVKTSASELAAALVDYQRNGSLTLYESLKLRVHTLFTVLTMLLRDMPTS